MEKFNPYRPGSIAHAGTFNNNVLSMAAGLKGLRDIYTSQAAIALNASGDQLRNRLNGVARKQDVELHFTGIGSMLNVHFQAGPITRAEMTWKTGEDAKRMEQIKKLFHLDMLAAGIYLARRGFISLSLPMTPAEHDSFVAAVEEFVTVRRPLLEGAMP